MNITYIDNPFEKNDRTEKTVEWEDVTLREFFDRHFADEIEDADDIYPVIGGKVVEWDDKPFANDEVMFIKPVGNNAGTAITAVVGVALIVVGAIYYQPLVPIGVSLLLGAAIGYMTNSMFGTDEPQGLADSATYSWSGIKTNVGEGAVVPVVFGKHRVGGHCIEARIKSETTKYQTWRWTSASSWTNEVKYLHTDGRWHIYYGIEDPRTQGLTLNDPSGSGVTYTPIRYNKYSTTENILYMLLAIGEGPMMVADTVNELRNSITINDTPLDDIDGVRDLDFRNGFTTNGGSAPRGFGEVSRYYGMTSSIKIMHTDSYTYTTQQNTTEAVTLHFVFPSGLFRIHSDGDWDYVGVQVMIMYRLEGAGTWSYLELDGDHTIVFEDNKKSSIGRSVDIDFGAPGTYEIYIGRETNDWDTSGDHTGDLYLKGVSEHEKEAVSYKGTATMGLVIEATNDLNGAMPNVNFDTLGIMISDVRGLQVGNADYGDYNGPYDNNIESSQNPANIIYALLSKKRWGLGQTVGEKTLDSLVEFADWCDEVVGHRVIENDTNNDGSIVPRTVFVSRKRYEINLVLDSNFKALEVIQKICSMCRAIPYWIGENLEIVVERDEGADPAYSQTFTMGNVVKDSYQEEYGGLVDVPTQIIGHFVDEDDNYEIKQIACIDKSRLNDPVVQKQLNMFGLTYSARVKREMIFALKKAKGTRCRISFEAALDAVVCRPGDIIRFQHDIPQYGFGGRILNVDSNRLYFDDSVAIQVGSHSIRVRRADGTIYLQGYYNGGSERTESELAVPEGHGVQAGDIWSFGPVGYDSKLFRVESITRSGENKFAIGAYEYNPDIFNEDEDFDVEILNSSMIGAVSKFDLDSSDPANPIVTWDENITGDKTRLTKPPFVTNIDLTESLVKMGSIYRPDIVIDWEPVSMPTGSLIGINRYQILCSMDGTNWTSIGWTQGESYYRYVGALAGKTYYFIVKPYTNYGVTNSHERHSSALNNFITPVGRPDAPGKLDGVQVLGGGSEFSTRNCSIEWAASTIPNLKHYRVEIYELSGMLVRSETVETRRHTYMFENVEDDFGGLVSSWRYIIFAVDTDDQDSEQSDTLTVTAAAPPGVNQTTILTPDGTTQFNTKDMPAVWDPVVFDALRGYRVWLVGGVGTGLSVEVEVVGPAYTLTYEENARLCLAAGFDRPASSITVNVQPISIYGVGGVWEAATLINPQPNPVSNLTGTSFMGGVKFYWDRSVESDFDHYEVRTRSFGDDAAQPVGTTIIIDDGDTGAYSMGPWNSSSAPAPYNGDSLYSTDAGYVYYWSTSESPAIGTFEVYAWWTSNTGRNTNAQYKIYDGGNYSDGLQLDTVYVDQTVNGGQWVLLGTYTFSEYARVAVESAGTVQTCADAIRLVSTDAPEWNTSFSEWQNIGDVNTFDRMLTDEERQNIDGDITFAIEVRVHDTFGNVSAVAANQLAAVQFLVDPVSSFDEIAQFFPELPLVVGDPNFAVTWSSGNLRFEVSWDAHRVWYDGTAYDIPAKSGVPSGLANIPNSASYLSFYASYPASSQYAAQSIEFEGLDGLFPMFQVRCTADQVAIADTLWNGSANAVIGSAYIGRASILTAHIQNAQIQNAHINDLSAAKVNAGILRSFHGGSNIDDCNIIDLDTGDIRFGPASNPSLVFDASTGTLSLPGGPSTDWSNITGKPSRFGDATVGAGLYLTSGFMGYFDGTSWRSYLQSDGSFRFGGSDPSQYIIWDGSTLYVRGSLNADDINTGSLSASRITAGTITLDKLSGTTGTLTLTGSKIVVATTDGLEVNNGASIKVNNGGDIVVVGGDSNPGELIFSSSDGSDRGVRMLSTTTDYGFEITPRTNAETYLTIGNGVTSNNRFRSVNITTETISSGGITLYAGNIGGTNDNGYARLGVDQRKISLRVNNSTDGRSAYVQISADDAKQWFGPETGWGKAIDLGRDTMAWGDAYADNHYTRCLFLDDIDDLEILHSMRGTGKKYRNTGLEALDISSLPKFMTNYDDLRAAVKTESGDMITDEDFDEMIKDEDELGYRLWKNIGHFDDLVAGSVRQSDRDLSEYINQFSSIIEGLILRIKKLEAA